MDLVILDGGHERRVAIERAGTGFAIEIDGRTFRVDYATVDDQLRSLVIDGRQWEVSARADGDGRYHVTAEGAESTIEVRDPLRHLALRSAPWRSWSRKAGGSRSGRESSCSKR
jgi:hypothetical protein